jgi:hypothetical protein
LTAFISSSSFVPLHFTGLESPFSFFKKDQSHTVRNPWCPGIIIIRQRDKWLFWLFLFFSLFLHLFLNNKSDTETQQM